MAKNPCMRALLEEKLGHRILVPNDPQMVGALGECTRSHNGAAWAVKLGYKNVYRYPGGIFAWKGAKYPVGKG